MISSLLQSADLSDRISPMLIKELRQGLRTRTFVAAFLLIQIVMVLISLLITIAASEGASTNDFTDVFWSILGILLLVVMPLRGFSALSSEMHDGTMEPLQLTHLTAWRITYGKWLALFSQTVLMCLALMPYIILRYYLGRTDLLDEGFRFALLLFLSGLLTAITVGASSQKPVFMKLVLLAGPALIIYLAYKARVYYRFKMGGYLSHFSMGELWIILVLSILALMFATYYALHMGATQIAPEAENHSTRKRLIGLIVIFINIGFMCMSETTAAYLFGIITLFLVLLCFDALTETTTLVPSVYESFFRRGRIGKLAAVFLCPGWAHGVYFLMICMIIWFFSFSIAFDMTLSGFAGFLMVVSMLIIPTALICLLFSRRRTLSLYLVILFCIGGLSFLIMIMDPPESVIGIASPLPPVSFMLILTNSHDPYDAKLWFAMTMLLGASSVPLAIAAVHGIRHFQKAINVHVKYRESQVSRQAELSKCNLKADVLS